MKLDCWNHALATLLLSVVIYATTPAIPPYRFREAHPVPEYSPQMLSLANALSLHRLKSAVFVDVRSATDYNAGHIEGALSAPNSAVLAKIGEADSLHRTIAIVYCESASCSKALLSAAQIRKQFSQVFVYSAGWTEWSQLGLPVDRP